MSLPLIFAKRRYPWLLVIWCGAYIIFSALSYLFIADSQTTLSVQALQTRLLSVGFLLLTTLLFSDKKGEIERLVRWGIFVALAVAIFNNFYDLLHPLIFSQFNVGRPAGWYINPNITASALIAGMIFTITLIPARWRIPLVALVGTGVFITFSRGGILTWLVVTVVLIFTKIIPRRKLLIWTIISIAVFFILGYTGQKTFNLREVENSDVLANNVIGRIDWLYDPTLDDQATQERFLVAQLAWAMFQNSPLFGNGIGSTALLADRTSSHNMYLTLMAEHGIFGLAIVPLLLYLISKKSSSETRAIAISFAAFIILWSIFSHNVLEERQILLSFSLMAVMSGKCKKIDKTSKVLEN